MWLTYPAGVTSGQMAVHIKTRRSGFTAIDIDGEAGWKTAVSWWREGLEHVGVSLSSEDFFTTETFLQAPGTAVQPTGTSGTSATWTGKVVAVDSAIDSILRRGQGIAGDARVTVNFGNNPTVDVVLNNLMGRVSGTIGYPPGFPSQTWKGLTLSNGRFSHTATRREIVGTFRNQGTTKGTNANTVGGLFDVYGTMKGGFVAKYSE